MLYVVSKVMECETFFNEAPFNSIESFAKIKLCQNTWNVMYICLFYDVVDQSNHLRIRLFAVGGEQDHTIAYRKFQFRLIYRPHWSLQLLD